MRQKFEAFLRKYKLFPNPADTQNRDNKIYLTNLILVHAVNYESSFFPLDLLPARFTLGP